VRTASKTRLCIPPSCGRELFWAPPVLSFDLSNETHKHAAASHDGFFGEDTSVGLLPPPSEFGAFDIDPH